MNARMLAPALGLLLGGSVVPAHSQSTVDDSAGALLRLDHAVVAVRDLDSASALFRSAGFRLKEGRLHRNGLLNRHIRFRDGTGIELMTPAGRPGDRMAREYAELLARGEGGAYAALRTDQLLAVEHQAKRTGFSTRRSRAGKGEFLTLEVPPDAHALFIGAGGERGVTPDSLMSHLNAVTGMASAMLEAGPELDAFLTACGYGGGDTVLLPDGRTGVRWKLQSGSLVIVRPADPAHPRLMGVEVRCSSRVPGRRSKEVLPGFWVIMQSSRQEDF